MNKSSFFSSDVNNPIFKSALNDLKRDLIKPLKNFYNQCFWSLVMININTIYVSLASLSFSVIAKRHQPQINILSSVKAAFAGGLITAIPYALVEMILIFYGLLAFLHNEITPKKKLPSPQLVLGFFLILTPLISETIGHILLKDDLMLPEISKLIF